MVYVRIKKNINNVNPDNKNKDNIELSNMSDGRK